MGETRWAWPVSLVTAASIVSIGMWRASANQAQARTAPAPVAVPQATTIVRERIVAVPAQPTAQPTAQVVERTPIEPQGSTTAKGYDEALFDMQQQFDETPRAAALEQRNQQTLRSIFQRLNFAAGLAKSGLECRGASCRAQLSFDGLEQAQSVLNKLPYDDEWKARSLGFNAVLEDPSKPDSQRYVVYFTSSDPSDS